MKFLIAGLLAVMASAPGALWAQPEMMEQPRPPNAEIMERMEMQGRHFEEQLADLREAWERFEGERTDMDALVLPPQPELGQVDNDFWGGIAFIAKVMPFPIGPNQVALIGPSITLGALRRALSHTIPEVGPASVEWQIGVYILANELPAIEGDAVVADLLKETGYQRARLLYSPRLRGREGERTEAELEAGGDAVGHLRLELALTPRRTVRGEVECRVSLELALENVPPGRFRHLRLNTTLVTPAGQPVWITSPDAMTDSAIALVLHPTVSP